MSQGKSYSAEFKKIAVARVDAGGSQSSVAKELDVSLSTLNKWIKAQTAMLLQKKSQSMTSL